MPSKHPVTSSRVSCATPAPAPDPLLILKALTLQGRRVRLAHLEALPSNETWKGIHAEEREGITESEVCLENFKLELLALSSAGMLESFPEAEASLPGYEAELASMVTTLGERKSAAGKAVFEEIIVLREALNL